MMENNVENTSEIVKGLEWQAKELSIWTGKGEIMQNFKVFHFVSNVLTPNIHENFRPTDCMFFINTVFLPSSGNMF